VSLSGTRAFSGPFVPARMTGEYGEVGGMRTGRRNRSTRREPAPVPLRPLNIPPDLT
jgi:hypothetical protein